MSSPLLMQLDEHFHDWEVGYLSIAVKLAWSHGSDVGRVLAQRHALYITYAQQDALIQLAETLKGL